MSPVKGPNFFGEEKNESFPRYHKNRKLYLSLYKNRSERYLGDASHYFSSETAPGEIHKFNPNAKIIIILRKPIDMAISHYKRGLIQNGIPFIESLNGENKDSVSLRKNLEYTKNLSRYREIFGDKNVKVLIFENLQNNPKKIKKELGAFLEINPFVFPRVPKLNASNESKTGWILTPIKFIPARVRIFLKKIIPILKLLKIEEFLESTFSGEEIKFEGKIPDSLKEKNNFEAESVEKIIKVKLAWRE